MAHPVVADTAESATTSAGTSHTVTLPGSIAAGDLLIVCLAKGSTAATISTLAGWTELLDEGVATGLFIAYRWATGGDSNPTFTTSTSTRSASIALRITGAENPATTPPAIGTTSSTSSNTPNPPSITPPSSKDYLFIALYTRGLEELDDDAWSNTSPTNYTPSPPIQKACGTAGTNLAGMIALAHRQLTTGSAEDPGTFGDDVATTWRAQTIIVHPGAAAVDVDALAKGTDFVAGTPSVDKAVDASAKASDFVAGTPSADRAVDASAKASDFVAGTPFVAAADWKGEVLADGPVVFLRLGEPSGTTAQDETANDNDGTYSGTPTLGATGFTPDGNTAVTFDATDDYVEIADDATLDVGDSFSVEFILGDDVPSGGGPFWLAQKGLNSWGVRIRFGQIEVVKQDPQTIATSTISIDDAEPHHVVVTKDGSDVHIVIDDTDVTGTVTNFTCSDTGDPIRVGATYWTTGSQLYDGTIDEFVVYDYALSSARISAHYAEAFPPPAVDVDALAKGSDFADGTPEIERTVDALAKDTDFVGGAPEIERTLDALAKDTDFVGGTPTLEKAIDAAAKSSDFADGTPEIERSVDALAKASDFVGGTPTLEKAIDAAAKASDFVGGIPEIERTVDALAKDTDFLGGTPEIERTVDALGKVSDFAGGLPVVEFGAFELLALAKDSDFAAGTPEIERTLDALAKASDFTAGIPGLERTVDALAKSSDEAFGLASLSQSVSGIGKVSDEAFGIPTLEWATGLPVTIISTPNDFDFALYSLHLNPQEETLELSDMQDLGPLLDAGLYPAVSLFPSESLFPDADDYAASPSPTQVELR